jgi:hypothetical protein
VELWIEAWEIGEVMGLAWGLKGRAGEAGLDSGGGRE